MNGHRVDGSNRWLNTIANGNDFEKFEPVGVGEDWRYEGKLSLGKALHSQGDLLHFSAFGK